MQGLKFLATIVDEIARVNEIVDRRTDAQKTGRLCRTLSADATKMQMFDVFFDPFLIETEYYTYSKAP